MAQLLNARLTVKNENIFHSNKMFRELIPVFSFLKSLIYFVFYVHGCYVCMYTCTQTENIGSIIGMTVIDDMSLFVGVGN